MVIGYAEFAFLATYSLSKLNCFHNAIFLDVYKVHERIEGGLEEGGLAT